MNISEDELPVLSNVGVGRYYFNGPVKFAGGFYTQLNDVWETNVKPRADCTQPGLWDRVPFGIVTTLSLNTQLAGVIDD